MFLFARWNCVSLAAVFCLIAAGAPAGAADLPLLCPKSPDLLFDFPAAVACRDVSPRGYAEEHQGGRLLAVELPVAVLMRTGEIERVDELRITIRLEEPSGGPGLKVQSYAPETTLTSEFTSGIEVQRSVGEESRFDASLGGVLPLAGGATAHVTPSLTVGRGEENHATETLTRKAPLEAVVVSAAIDRRRGVQFKLRPSSQTTLEGEHRLSVTFAAPAPWRGGRLEIECVARGTRKWLWREKPAVWAEQTGTVLIEPARHTVAKPVARGPITVEHAFLAAEQ